MQRVTLAESRSWGIHDGILFTFSLGSLTLSSFNIRNCSSDWPRVKMPCKMVAAQKTNTQVHTFQVHTEIIAWFWRSWWQISVAKPVNSLAHWAKRHLLNQQFVYVAGEGSCLCSPQGRNVCSLTTLTIPLPQMAELSMQIIHSWDKWKGINVGMFLHW